MIPWLQAQAHWLSARRGEQAIEVIVTAPPTVMETSSQHLLMKVEKPTPPIGLLMTRKEALDAAQALLQAVANESGLEVKISATPVPEILRCPNKVA